jgi:hypothetical protein
MICWLKTGFFEIVNFLNLLGGCPINTVFNPAEQKCDEPENVPGCQDYYKI